MRRSKFILLLLESYFLNCRMHLATLHKNLTGDLLHHVTMHVIPKHTEPPHRKATLWHRKKMPKRKRAAIARAENIKKIYKSKTDW